MSRLGSFTAAGIGGIVGAVVGGFIESTARGMPYYVGAESTSELMGAIVGSAVFAAISVDPACNKPVGVSGAPAALSVRFP